MSKHQKMFSQIDLREPPSQDTNLVRWIDMVDYMNALVMRSVRVVMTALFAGTYNATDMTLTQSTPAELEIDGVTVDTGDRILVAGQLDKTLNGIYVVSTLGTAVVPAVLTRADDFNASSEIKNRAIIPIGEGDTYGVTRWRVILGAVPFILDSVTIEFKKIIVDMTKIEEFAFEIVGDTTTSVYDFTHNLDTMNIVMVGLYETDTGEEVTAGPFIRTSPNSVQINFGSPLGDGYALVMICHAKVEKT